MSLLELVELAKTKDLKFKKKFDRLVSQRKTPDLRWLMPKLEAALGKDFVKEQAMKHVRETSEVENDS